MRYFRINHGPITWVKALSEQDAEACLVEEGMGNEEDPNTWSVEEMPSNHILTLRGEKGSLNELFGEEPRSILASTEY